MTTRAAARHEARDSVNELRSMLESIINDPNTATADREAALQELTQVNSRWSNLTSKSFKVDTYNRAERDFHDRALELRIDLASREAAATTYFSVSTEYGLNHLPSLVPMGADWTDGGSMAALLERNPEGFKRWWSNLDSSEREVAMMKLQEHQQLASQLQMMMTNFLSAQHDSAMAIARNLAV